MARLSAAIRAFNVFDALRVARREVQHSNFLGWLLDPAESHGQSDLFLRAFLGCIAEPTPSLRDVEVRREHENIDLLIVCRSAALVVAVENKLESDEHSDQLRRYHETVLREFPNDRHLFVLLSPDGREASRGGWLCLGFHRLHDAIAAARTGAGASLNPLTGAFIDHYLAVIRRSYMPDPAVVELCRSLYRKHQSAFDLVWEHKRTPETRLIESIRSKLGVPPFQMFLSTHHRPRQVDFVPHEWATLLPQIGTERNNEAWQWLSLLFIAEGEALYFKLVIGPVRDTSRRQRVTDSFRARPELGFNNDPSGKIGQNSWRALWSHKLISWKGEGPDQDSVTRLALARLHAEMPKVEATTDLLRELFADAGKEEAPLPGTPAP
ncbi:MAG: PD-(D/E)XK nuclease family protein [Phycisphaerales bacterium]|nr:PD-(D/E)XK nuclease family protein [Phycisphaerales bacterium]